MRSKKSRARGLVQRTSCSASNLPVPTIISPEKIDSGTSGFSAAGREQPKNSAQRRSAEEKALAQDGRARAMAFAVFFNELVRIDELIIFWELVHCV